MSLVWPFDTKDPSQYQRVDQGWDLQTGAGGVVRAVADGILGRANADPGAFGNDYPYEILDPAAVPAGAPSDTVYYGHTHELAALVGQHVTAGQIIAVTNTTDPQNGSAAPPGWLELGFAQHGTGAPVQRGSGPTAAGDFVRNLFGAGPATAGVVPAAATNTSLTSSATSSLGAAVGRLIGELALVAGAAALIVLGAHRAVRRPPNEP